MPQVIEVLRAAEAFCFDVDSTVCTDEGIDELAEWCGAGEAVRVVRPQQETITQCIHSIMSFFVPTVTSAIRSGGEQFAVEEASSDIDKMNIAAIFVLSPFHR
jgi:phosphoserine phosphatase